MGREELLMMQLFGGGGGLLQSTDWMKVVFLAFLVAIPVVWPDRIRITSSYRAAYICFALSIIVPSATSVLMTTLVTPNVISGRNSGDNFSGLLTLRMVTAAGPVLFGISLILAMKAIVPGFIPPTTSRHRTDYDEPPTGVGGRSFDENAAESQSR